MLTGLDQVNWRRLSHAYGSAENVPSLLLALASADDSNVEEIWDELANNINHQGTIYKATPYAVPYLIQILRLGTPNRKYALYLLSNLVENCANLTAQSLGSLSDEIATYQAISKGVDSYLVCLSDTDVDIKLVSASLLGTLVNQRNYIRPRLKRAWLLEANPIVAAEMIYQLGFLIPESSIPSQKAVWRKYAQLFEGLVQNHPDEIIQIAAASAWAVMQSPWQDIIKKPEEKPFIFRALGSACTRVAFLADINNLTGEFLWETALLEKVSKLGIYALAYTLETTQFDAFWCHKFAREMLEMVFDRHYPRNVHGIFYSFDKWLDHRSPADYQYTLNPPNIYTRIFHPDKPLTEKQRFVLGKIIACDPFWELPTNLFSFFYGLPDERSELQRLLDAAK